MESVKQFGIQPVLLLAQIVNFMVLLYLLKRFLYKPILTMLKKREEKIKEGLEAAAKGEEMLVKAKAEEKDILHKASEEAEVLIDETKNRAIKLEEGILAGAKEETEQMLSRARVQIREEEKLAESRLEKRVVHIATEVLENMLPNLLTKEDQEKILASSTKMLEKAVS